MEREMEFASCISKFKIVRKKALIFFRWHEEKFKPIDKGDAIFTEDKYKSLHTFI